MGLIAYKTIRDGVSRIVGPLATLSGDLNTVNTPSGWAVDFDAPTKARVLVHLVLPVRLVRNGARPPSLTLVVAEYAGTSGALASTRSVTPQVSVAGDVATYEATFIMATTVAHPDLRFGWSVRQEGEVTPTTTTQYALDVTPSGWTATRGETSVVVEPYASQTSAQQGTNPPPSRQLRIKGSGAPSSTTAFRRPASAVRSTLSWRWSAYSEANYDYLTYALDGAAAGSGTTGTISGIATHGSPAYTSPTPVVIPAGSVFEFRYIKDGGGDVGTDSGYVIDLTETFDGVAPVVIPGKLLTSGTRSGPDYGDVVCEVYTA